MKKFLKFIFSFFLIFFPINLNADTNLLKLINEIDANIIFVRHTLAPGFGDPQNFNIDNCNTQRNLNEEGRNQAKIIGNVFKKNNLIFSEILSSEWCRCKETTDLLNIGEWKTFGGLNSFFQKHSNKREVMKKLIDKIEKLDDNHFILMVTHLVIINEITGISPPSGGIVLYNSKNKRAKVFNLKFN